MYTYDGKKPEEFTGLVNKSFYIGMKTVRGFSLIELVIVVGILVVLSALAVPSFEAVQIRSRERQLRESLFEVRRAIDGYRMSMKDRQLPKTLGELVFQIPLTNPNLKSGGFTGPFLASGTLRNPFTYNRELYEWDIRDGGGVWHKNQKDPATLFAAGVFDIRFPTEGVGGWKKALDETLYSEW